MRIKKTFKKIDMGIVKTQFRTLVTAGVCPSKWDRLTLVVFNRFGTSFLKGGSGYTAAYDVVWCFFW